jgi:Icc-related predicted phosphoesterase
MTKLIVFSDTHGRHNQLSLPSADIAIFAGDMCGMSNKTSVYNFLIWYSKQLPIHKIFIAGNHDIPFEKDVFLGKDIEEMYPNLTYLQDESVTIDGLKIYGSPWSPTFGNWAFNLPRNGEELRKKWAAIPSDTDIIVTHGPPFGILDKNSQGENCGCKLLRDRIEEVMPRLSVFGHIHPAQGVICNSSFRKPVTYVNAALCNDNNYIVNLPIELEI